jgi:hypothetical protein
MKILTFNDLADIRKSLTGAPTLRTASLAEGADVFLSHSAADKDFLQPVVQLLRMTRRQRLFGPG